MLCCVVQSCTLRCGALLRSVVLCAVRCIVAVLHCGVRCIGFSAQCCPVLVCGAVRGDVWYSAVLCIAVLRCAVRCSGVHGVIAVNGTVLQGSAAYIGERGGVGGAERGGHCDGVGGVGGWSGRWRAWRQAARW